MPRLDDGFSGVGESPFQVIPWNSTRIAVVPCFGKPLVSSSVTMIWSRDVPDKLAEYSANGWLRDVALGCRDWCNRLRATITKMQFG